MVNPPKNPPFLYFLGARHDEFLIKLNPPAWARLLDPERSEELDGGSQRPHPSRLLGHSLIALRIFFWKIQDFMPEKAQIYPVVGMELRRSKELGLLIFTKRLEL